MEAQNSNVLFSEGGINYVYLNDSHKEEAIKMLTEVFVEAEPFGTMCGIKKEGFEGLHSIPWHKHVNNGLSVAAVDEATGKLAGVFTAEDHSPKLSMSEEMAEGKKYMQLFEKNKEFEVMWTLVPQLHEPINAEQKAIMKQHKLQKHGLVCHMVCVAVSKDFGRRGIGGHLTNLLKKNCADRGYWLAYAECSSLYSTKALTKFGGQIEKTIDYKTW